MAQSTIEWTQKVWNPTTGCNKVSPGCKNCYAEIMHRRLLAMQPGKYKQPFLKGAVEHPASLEIPFKWKKSSTVFVNSMSDLFHEALSVEYIAKVYSVMFLTPHHTYQILTKRPQRRLKILQSDEFFKYLGKYSNQFHKKFIQPVKNEADSLKVLKSSFPFQNVWEGTSIENQKTADERIPLLLQTPASLRWLSAEPLLGEIDMKLIDELSHKKGGAGIDWIVVGGESGHRKRPVNPDWLRHIRDYCQDTGIKFFVKQIDKVQEIPDDLMIREYPTLEPTIMY